MAGQDLAKTVSCKESYTFDQGLQHLDGSDNHSKTPNDFHVVAMDFGSKKNILRLLVHHGCRVTVVPADTNAKDILALQPDGIFLSNGPGDPASMPYAVETVRALIGKKPVLNCMGRKFSHKPLEGVRTKCCLDTVGRTNPYNMASVY